MALKALSHIVQLGTDPGADPRRNQVVRLVNQVCLFVIGVIIPHLLVTLCYRAMWATLFQLPTIVLMALTIVVNARRHYDAARIMTLVIGNLHIAYMSAMLGIESGVHLYFAAAVIAPLFFYRRKEIRLGLLFSAFTMVLAMAMLVLLTDSEPFVEASPALLTFFFYLTQLGTLTSVLVFVYYFYAESNRFENELEDANRRLSKLARTDALTQLANKRSFDTSFEREWGRASRIGSALTVVMIDVDNFKHYNDTYGHQAGDVCLAKVAGAISQHTREYVDIPARYGGEEFIVLMSDTVLDDGSGAAERIREEIELLEIQHERNEDYGVVTCSFGVASCVPEKDMAPGSLIRQADEALYAAKERGRNRVERGGVS